MRGRLAELSAAGLALECSGWLDALCASLRGLGGRLLGPAASGADLLAVEAAVKAALEEWQYTLQPPRWAGCCFARGESQGSVCADAPAVCSSSCQC